MSEEKKSPQVTVNDITDRLEAGLKALFEGDNFRNYLNTMSKFHSYSFNNTMLIALQNPDATLVAGFQSWKKNFERNVNKGEKGIKILAPAPYKIKKEQEKIDPDTDLPVLDKDGKPVMEEVTIQVPAFKVVSVFDVSQTSGKELPTLGVDELKGDVKDFEKFFGVLKEISPVPIKLDEIDGSAKGFYHQTDKSITIQQDMPEIQTIKTAIHEIAHAKLHDRDMQKADIDAPPKDRSTEEVEAESIAYTVCQHFGIDTSDYSFAYVASWGSGKETPELKSSLETIRSTSSELITQISDKLREVEKERTAEQTAEQTQEISTAQSNEVVSSNTAPTAEKAKNSNIIGNTPYKDIAEKKYLKIQTSQLPTVEKFLEGANIPYSGRKTGKSTTITVGEKDYMQLCNYVNELTGKTVPANEVQRDKNIIGNTDYKDIADKYFVRMSADKATEIAAKLEKYGIKFSGLIEGEKATITINKADKEAFKELMISPEEVLKSFRNELTVAQTEYEKAEQAVMAADDVLSFSLMEYDEVKDENGQISDLAIKERVTDNLKSAISIKEFAENNLAEKESDLKMAFAEYKDALSAVKPQETDHFKIPLVLGIYNAERNEYTLEALRQSNLENRQCSSDISKALSDNTELKEFGVKVGTKKALEQIMAQYPEERIAAVLATQVIPSRDYLDNPEFVDKRYSPEVRAWAKSTISANENFDFKNFDYCNISDKHHPNIVNALAKDFISAQEKSIVAEYTGRLPDESVTIQQMEEYGYRFVPENEMLPLGTEKASQLLEYGAEVYRLYEDNSESVIEDVSEIAKHNGLFGIEKAEWYKMLPIVEHFEALSEAQPQREEFLLHGDVPAAAGIYQLTEGAATRDIRFMNSEYLESKGVLPDRENYTLVYSFEVLPEDLSNKTAFLNNVFEKYNTDHPNDYEGRSLSVSDVVVIRNGDELSAHYVDSVGFKELENFGEVHRELPQNTVESVADIEKRVKSGEAINLMDLHKAIQNEQKQAKSAKSQAKASKPKAEKKPSVLGAIEEIKKNSPQQSVAKQNEKGVEL